ncbi:MAG: hypothetical protein ACYSW3_00365 [Planctomycetota bacterium]|jgi:hypothetical protein
MTMAQPGGETRGDRQAKHMSILVSLGDLSRKVDQIESVACRIESGNDTPPKTVDGEGKVSSPSLAHVLEHAPTWIQEQIDRMDGYIRRIEDAVF